MRRALQTVGWGLYLASSWTWCIGMFLPILLLRWWGWPGFLAFAVPNVLGCAMFGYALTPETSRAMVTRFRVWIALFGAATIAYQIGFLVRTGVTAALIAALPATLAMVVAARRASVRSDRGMMVIGACAWIASCLLFARLGSGELDHLPTTGTLPPASLAWAAPFMAFGFLLCPYLDPTFHVALQRSPSRHCFAVFGAAFTVMLLFTAAFSDAGLGPTPAPGALLWGKPVFEWQWGLQAAFTMVAVAAALRSLEPVSRLGGTTAVLPGLIVMACLALGWQYLSESALPPMAAALRPASGPVLGEATYLRWLGLYGVLFPAMVLLGLRRTPVAVIVISIAGAGLLAEWGMIGGRFPMLTAAVGLLLAASMWSERPIDDSGEMTHVKPR